MKLIHFSVFGLAALLCALPSCSDSPENSRFDDPNMSLKAVSARFSPDESEANEAMNGFTLKFISALNENYSPDLVKADNPGNFVVSPVSAAISLVMAGNFDDADYRNSLAAALGLDDFDAVNSLCGKLIPALQNSNNGAYLRMANSMWYAPWVTPRQDRCDILSQTFDATISPADFAGDLEPVKRKMNDWVSAQTDGMIRKMYLEPDQFTAAFFINALYFQSQWAECFDAERTVVNLFKGTENLTDVRMMRNELTTRIGLCEGYSIAALPYKGGEMALYLILPPEGEDMTRATARVFSPEFNADLFGSLGEGRLILGLPKINMKNSLETERLFAPLGIADGSSFAFLERNDNEDFAVKAAQDVVLQWDEKETKAAVVSETGLVVTSPGPPINELKMILDRPFLFMIVSKTTGTCLLAGRICNL